MAAAAATSTPPRGDGSYGGERIEHARRRAQLAAEKERVRTKRSAMNAIDAALTLIHGLQESLLTQTVPPLTTSDDDDNGVHPPEPMLTLVDDHNEHPQQSQQPQHRPQSQPPLLQLDHEPMNVAVPTADNDTPPPLPLSRPPSFIPPSHMIATGPSHAEPTTNRRPTPSITISAPVPVVAAVVAVPPPRAALQPSSTKHSTPTRLPLAASVPAQPAAPSTVPPPPSQSSIIAPSSSASPSSSPMRVPRLLAAASSPYIASARLHADGAERRARHQSKRDAHQRAKAAEVAALQRPVPKRTHEQQLVHVMKQQYHWLQQRKQREKDAGKDGYSHQPQINPISNAIATAKLQARASRERKKRPDEMEPQYSFHPVISPRSHELAVSHPDRPSIPGSPVHDHLYQHGLATCAERMASSLRRDASLTKDGAPPLSPGALPLRTPQPSDNNDQDHKRAFSPSSPRPIAQWTELADRHRLASYQQPAAANNERPLQSSPSTDIPFSSLITPARSTTSVSSLSPPSSANASTSIRSLSVSPVRGLLTEPWMNHRSRKRMMSSTTSTANAASSSGDHLAPPVSVAATAPTVESEPTSITIPLNAAPPPNDLRISVASRVSKEDLPTMIARSQQRQATRDKRLAMIAAEVAAREVAECTFKPVIYTKKDGSSSVTDEKEQSGAMMNDRAVLRYVDRQREARKMKAMAARPVWITGSGWTRQGSQADPIVAPSVMVLSSSQALAITLPRPSSAGTTMKRPSNLDSSKPWGLTSSLTPTSFPAPNLALPATRNNAADAAATGAHGRAHVSPLVNDDALLTSHYSSGSYTQLHQQKQVTRQQHHQRYGNGHANGKGAQGRQLRRSSVSSQPSSSTKYHEPEPQPAPTAATTLPNDQKRATDTTQPSPATTADVASPDATITSNKSQPSIPGLRTLWSPIEERPRRQPSQQQQPQQPLATNTTNKDEEDVCSCCGFIDTNESPTSAATSTQNGTQHHRSASVTSSVVDLPTFDGVDEWPTHDDSPHRDDAITSTSQQNNNDSSEGPLSPSPPAARDMELWPVVPSSSSSSFVPSLAPPLWSPQPSSQAARTTTVTTITTTTIGNHIAAETSSMMAMAAPSFSTSDRHDSGSGMLLAIPQQQSSSLLSISSPNTPDPGAPPRRHHLVPTSSASTFSSVLSTLHFAPDAPNDDVDDDEIDDDQRRHGSNGNGTSDATIAAAHLARDIDVALALGTSALLLSETY